MFLPISLFSGANALHLSLRLRFSVKIKCHEYSKKQAAGVTLLPLESPLKTRVFEADFEGVGYVYLFLDFRGKGITFLVRPFQFWNGRTYIIQLHRTICRQS